MRLLFFAAILFQWMILWGCKSAHHGTQSWLSSQYAKCLEMDLPCECEKQVKTFYSLILDTNPASKNFGVVLSKFSEMEADRYPIRKVTETRYEVLDNSTDALVWARINIGNSNLQFIGDNMEVDFSKSKTVNGYNVNHSGTDNVFYLNKALRARGYENLENIVGTEPLMCDCNKWMGGQNLMYVKGQSKLWIIETRNDSLRILKVTNPEKDPDDPVQTQLVAAYKWR
jgi:hypothetical protein